MRWLLAAVSISIPLSDSQALQVAGQRPPAASSATAGSPRALRVQRGEIMDRTGFEKPLVAYTLFVPVGWRAEGSVEYAAMNSCGPDHRVNWRATAPDGSASIQIVPEEKWSASTMAGQDPCLHSPAASMRPYLEWWVQRNRPGAR
ncbi:MAG: hypothetical protein ABI679_12825, partial [Gemmatimonadota bacterium]